MVGILFAAGCCSKKPAQAVAPIVPVTQEAPKEAGLGNGLGSPLQEKKSPGARISLPAVYFNTNSFALTPATKENLATIAQSLKELKATHILLMGHCDERGSRAYNDELGYYRAKAVALYLNRILQGPDFNVASRGKDRPVCNEHTPACWARCRRVEIEAIIP